MCVKMASLSTIPPDLFSDSRYLSISRHSMAMPQKWHKIEIVQIDIGLSIKIASLPITGVPEAVIWNATPHMSELMRELMKPSLLRIQPQPPDITM